MTKPLSIDTLAVRGGHYPRLGEGISPPIDLSTTFYLPADGAEGILAYGRSDVPAYRLFEQAVADVERAKYSIVFNSGTSGMIALADELKPGDRVVFMADGAVVEENTPEEFFTNPTSDRAKDFLGKILKH